MYFAKLNQRRVLRVSGEDAVPFLQGLVSNDVTRLAEGAAMYAALLSPQGKFLHDFFLLRRDGAILLDVDASRAAGLLQRLNMYRLRSKVTLEATDMPVAAAWGEESGPPAGALRDPRLAALGWRIVGEAAVQGMECVDDAAYDRMRLALGVPEGGRDLIENKSLLLEFGFEDLHGVDFAKGCYVGQEVTARTKYRATLRRFIYQARAQTGELPEAGTPVLLGDMPIGEMRSSRGDIGLALLKIEFVQRAQTLDMALHAGTCAFKAALPQWVKQAPTPLMAEE